MLQARHDPPPPSHHHHHKQFHSIKKGNIKTHQRLYLVTVPRVPPPFSSAQLIKIKRKKREEENKDLNEQSSTGLLAQIGRAHV